MRRIQVWRDAIIDVNEPVVSMSPKDYRPLLAVARVADKWQREEGHIPALVKALAALNARPDKGKRR
jgi:hypothetical protein